LASTRVLMLPWSPPFPISPPLPCEVIGNFFRNRSREGTIDRSMGLPFFSAFLEESFPCYVRSRAVGGYLADLHSSFFFLCKNLSTPKTSCSFPQDLPLLCPFSPKIYDTRHLWEFPADPFRSVPRPTPLLDPKVFLPFRTSEGLLHPALGVFFVIAFFASHNHPVVAPWFVFPLVF